MLLVLPIVFSAQPTGGDPIMGITFDNDNYIAEYGPNWQEYPGTELTFTNAFWTSGRGVTSFQGVSYLRNASAVTYSTFDGSTIMFWLYTGTAATNKGIFQLKGTGTNEISFIMDGSTKFYLDFDYGSSIVLQSPNNVPNNVWVNIALVFNLTHQTIYFNGTYVTSITNTRDIDDLGGIRDVVYGYNIEIGGTLPTNTAIADDIYIFDYDLTPAEILTVMYENYTGTPPYVPPAINVTITSPENNYGFNASRLLALNSAITITTYHNMTDVNCTINGTGFSYFDTDGDTHTYFRNDTYLPNGLYNYLVLCSNITNPTINASDSVSFRIDTTPPSIAPTILLSGNNTFTINSTLITQINFTDDVEIYSINVTFKNGTNVYSASNLGQSHYELNISRQVDETITNYLDVEVCDAHTNEQIKNIDRIDVDKKGLKFVIEDNPLFMKDKWVSVYPKEYSEYLNSPTTDKQLDRYTFTFNKAVDTKNTETFVVESSEYIDIAKIQKYGGHLIIPSLNRWIDFENKDAKKYDIKRISSTMVEITVHGLKNKAIRFESIGELNCVSSRYYFGNLNPSTTYTQYVLVGESSNIYLDINTPETLSSVSATLYYNNTPYSIGSVANFSKQVTAPSVVGGNSTNIPFYWVLTANGNNYTTSTQYQNVSNIFIDNCSSYPTTSMIILFKNVTGLVPAIVSGIISLTGDVAYSSLFIDVQNISLCIFPAFVSLDENFVVQYNDGGDNFYYESVHTLTNSTQTLSLYVQQDTEATTFTIKDIDTSQLLIDVYASMYRLIDGSWTVVQSKYSDLTGRVQFAFEPDVQYKFFLSKSSYNPYIFYLNPIIFDAYDVLMTKNTSSSSNYDYDGVSLLFAPKFFYDDQTNNFTFIIQSPLAKLLTYGYTLTYPSGTSTQSGSTNVGGQLNSSFEISGSTFGDRLKVDYYYETETSGIRSFIDYYEIMIAPSNSTMIHNKDETYGMGLFERTLIAVLIALFIVGIGSLIGQPLPSFILSMFIYFYLSYIGFLPYWSIAFTLIFGFIAVSLKGE